MTVFKIPRFAGQPKRLPSLRPTPLPDTHSRA
ncbi:hypothetical protein PMNALOAF_3535 [Methylobacterium adhaesivum]|nr:hypothetical protein PMNALOAF_3535 [Methylobacterium adhaesivum]